LTPTCEDLTSFGTATGCRLAPLLEEEEQEEEHEEEEEEEEEDSLVY
jgi:hypothetical protein